MYRVLIIKSLTIILCCFLGLGLTCVHLMNFSIAQAATILTVNLATDAAGDVSPGDGNCDSDGGTSGNQCTLRAAIEEANALAGKDTIVFRIGSSSAVPRYIYILSELPAISEDIEINGDNQTGGGAVTLNGTNAGEDKEGLIFEAGDSEFYDLIVYHFDGAGVLITGTASVTMTANTIYGGGNAGIRIYSSNNTIGGVSPSDRNYIYDNDHGGIRAKGLSGAITGIYIQNNYIGLDRNGNTNLPNGTWGVLFDNVSESIIGGAGAGNVLAGNNLAFSTGIELQESKKNYITGNIIGTDASGTQDSGFDTGISLRSSSENIIGGFNASYRNLISGNDVHGIVIELLTASVISPDSNRIIGNFIGTNITGTSAIPNGNGIFMENGVNNYIGSGNVGGGNIIAGNDDQGLQLETNDVHDLYVYGNSIGVDVNGDPLGNSGYGIYISGIGDTYIGGMDSGEENVIANNGIGPISRPGICIDGSTGIEIFKNSIYNNGWVTSTNGLGIDLAGDTGCDGVTANDIGDSDMGSNKLINYPVLTDALWNDNMVTISGTLNSTVTSIFRIDFYGNHECDASGHGEGRTYLNSKSVLTDKSGNASFSIDLPYAKYYTALTTDMNDNTSEFSARIEGPKHKLFLPILLR